MTAINDVVDLSLDGEIAVITVNSPPVNALSAPVRDGIAEGVTSAVADPDVKAIVLICAGRTFIAGADITEFGKPPRGTSLHQMIDVIESATKPVIAAIHGTALGGGLETALGAHYRVAVPSAKLGLPEVKLGLLPGAGGTQRLPRVVGAEAALKMVTSGNPIGAKAALDSGLVDELVDEADLRGGAIAFAQKVFTENRPLKKIRDRSVTADPALFAEFRAANARKFRGFDAPEANIKCIEAAVTLPFEEGMKRERELFMGLMTGTQSAAQRHIFFAERQAARIKDLPEGTAPRPIKSVGVIGAGTMGGGISMNFLSAGIPVTIVETSPEALDRGVGIMRKNYAASAAKGALKPEAVEANMGRLTPVLDLEALKDCDLIIEAVFEDMAIKKEIFAKLDRIAKPGAILASNTSYLDVNEIASATSRPQDVVGLHFFSPANVMKLLEVVRGAKTAPDVLATAMSLAKTIGKVAVVAGVCFGFIGNRMLRARQDQAQALILEGAMPWDVDRVLYDFGFPMGPFQMADLAGLDIGWNAATSKGETVRDRLCEAGKRGQKTGSGFYDYDEKRNRTPSKVAEEIILAKSAELGIARRQISDAEILERCLYPMINEGAKILEEGIAQRPSDIDVAWIYGYGFPVYRGGPMFYGDTVGLKAVLEGLEKYEKVHGAAFKPAALLGKLAAEGKSFRDLN
ncbi:3-hydroxyacyl-CoA dehydrogenase NAD-binding domain-containing protein [Sphingosinicella sp.]|uniref:3-hydroxyacyl-CoA dehydrogenase NAD-binding domain-containing protein n=1 Tax=Sphingosinicella sp. TaxID=1917971 RepID=UPI00263257E7|nr:3-hydroxyacyl-CoA dehydrogenase NAD-binding domain-containing protein [Sphingosinicella sp.]